MATKIVDNRVNFASVHNPYPYPDFLDVQLKSFKDFLQLDTPPEERKNDGLYKVFSETSLSPILVIISFLSSWITILTLHAILLMSAWREVLRIVYL